MARSSSGTRGGATPRASKPCAHCGRPFDNRKRWEGRAQWDEVLYCSRGCRSKAAAARRGAPGSATPE